MVVETTCEHSGDINVHYQLLGRIDRPSALAANLVQFVGKTWKPLDERVDDPISSQERPCLTNGKNLKLLAMDFWRTSPSNVML